MGGDNGLDGRAAGAAEGDGVEADAPAGNTEDMTDEEPIAQWRLGKFYMQRLPGGDLVLMREDESFRVDAAEASFVELFIKSTTDALAGAQWLASYAKMMSTAEVSGEEPREE